jgi:protein SCO1/2
MRTQCLLLLSVFLFACGSGESEEKEESLKVFPNEIGDFTLINQDSTLITRATFEGKIFVTDFFFTSCPSICPIMASQMLRVYEKFEDRQDVLLLSHSIDPKRDSVDVLKSYANKLGVSSDRWHFVTGPKDRIYGLAEEYMVTAFPDESVPGGYEHSGYFILVDKNWQVRGFYDGTKAEEVDELMNDMETLLNEE